MASFKIAARFGCNVPLAADVECRKGGAITGWKTDEQGGMNGSVWDVIVRWEYEGIWVSERRRLDGTRLPQSRHVQARRRDTSMEGHVSERCVKDETSRVRRTRRGRGGGARMKGGRAGGST